MKDQLIRDLIEANHRLMKALALMPAEAKVKQWSKKEILAHLAGWYEEGVISTPQILKGEKPASFRMSINGFNKKSVFNRKNKTVPELEKEMASLHQKFIKLIKDLTEKQITGLFGTKLGKENINLLWMINECISHDNAHAQELEERYLMEKKKSKN